MDNIFIGIAPPHSNKISSSPSATVAAAAAAAVAVEEKSNRCLPLCPVAVARIRCQLPPLPSAAAADTGEGKNTLPPSSTTTVICRHCHPLLQPSPLSKKIHPPLQSSITTVVCRHCHPLLPPSPPSKKNHYYYLAPLISAMNKGFLESIDLICSQRNLIL